MSQFGWDWKLGKLVEAWTDAGRSLADTCRKGCAFLDAAVADRVRLESELEDARAALAKAESWYTYDRGHCAYAVACPCDACPAALARSIHRHHRGGMMSRRKTIDEIRFDLEREKKKSRELRKKLREARRVALAEAIRVACEVEGQYPPEIFPPPNNDDEPTPEQYSAAGARLAALVIRNRLAALRSGEAY